MGQKMCRLATAEIFLTFTVMRTTLSIHILDLLKVAKGPEVCNKICLSHFNDTFK